MLDRNENTVLISPRLNPKNQNARFRENTYYNLRPQLSQKSRVAWNYN